MRARGISSLLFFALVAFSPRGEAQAHCAGFTDVGFPGSANPSCQNVIWMKNRSITLGCTPTQYCPNQGVIRLSMAAFMNRMGNALTPQALSTEESGGTLDFTTETILCQTAELPAPVGPYPRTVDADASLSFDVSGVETLRLQVVRSKNGGTFNAMGQENQTSVGSGMRQHASTITAADLQSDSIPVSFKFGLRVSRTLFNAVITSWACHLQVLVRNATYLGL